MAEPETPDFFVGYLRTPLRLVRFVAIAACVLLLGVDVVALLLDRAQTAPPSGNWGDSETAFEGVLLARPYPVVLVAATASAPAYAVVLVSEGKHGAPPGLEPLDGKRVHAQGYPLLRRGEGLTVLQLSQMPRAADGAVQPVAATTLGERTITGVIEDSKCLFGAMNPGAGKVHEPCAALCLLGGIPPLFVSRDDAGRLTYRLLADEDGGPMAQQAADHAGAPITLTGNLTRLDGIELFAVKRGALD
jgi:hypothetical protein